jgi:hypothetical protein
MMSNFDSGLTFLIYFVSLAIKYHLYEAVTIMRLRHLARYRAFLSQITKLLFRPGS